MQESAQSLAALNRPVAADVRIPREQQEVALPPVASIAMLVGPDTFEARIEQRDVELAAQALGQQLASACSGGSLASASRKSCGLSLLGEKRPRRVSGRGRSCQNGSSTSGGRGVPSGNARGWSGHPYCARVLIFRYHSPFSLGKRKFRFRRELAVGRIYRLQ